ncbi:MAG: hypothetical protein WCG91_02325 [Candidatus Shapirobacteria bacterium]
MNFFKKILFILALLLFFIGGVKNSLAYGTCSKNSKCQPSNEGCVSSSLAGVCGFSGNTGCAKAGYPYQACNPTGCANGYTTVSNDNMAHTISCGCCSNTGDTSADTIVCYRKTCSQAEGTSCYDSPVNGVVPTSCSQYGTSYAPGFDYVARDGTCPTNKICCEKLDLCKDSGMCLNGINCGADGCSCTTTKGIAWNLGYDSSRTCTSTQKFWKCNTAMNGTCGSTNDYYFPSEGSPQYGPAPNYTKIWSTQAECELNCCDLSKNNWTDRQCVKKQPSSCSNADSHCLGVGYTQDATSTTTANDTCHGKKVDTTPTCGIANNHSFSFTPPISSLCSNGTFNSLTDHGGAWTWACNGTNDCGASKTVNCGTDAINNLPECTCDSSIAAGVCSGHTFNQPAVTGNCKTKFDCPGTKTAVNAYCSSGSCSPQCGQWNNATCLPGNDCGTQCGNLSCGGSCGTSDTGSPGMTTLSSPVETIISPKVYASGVSVVSLNWLKNSDSKASYYNIGVWHDEPGKPDIRDLDFDTSDINTVSTKTGFLTPGVLYRWGVNTKNITCLGYIYSGIYESGWSTLGYFKRSETSITTPTLTFNNFIGEVVPPDSTDKNHICQSEFKNGTDQIISVIATSSDTNAVSAYLRMNNNSSNPLLIGPVSYINNKAIFPIKDDGSSYTSDPYNVVAYSVNNLGETSPDSGSKVLKIWNCEVGVGGSFKKGIDNNPFTDFTNLTPLKFNEITMNIDELNSNYNGILIFGNTYNYSFKKNNFKGTSSMEVSDINGYFTPKDKLLIDSNITNPYLQTHTVSANFILYPYSDPWWQTDGNVLVKNEIKNNIPSDKNISTRGLVAATAGNITNNLSFVGDLNDNNNGYEYFYKNYYVNLGQGVTATTVGTGQTGVVFIQDLDINNDITINNDQFLMVVVKGNINIGVGVSKIDGIYVANGNININGKSDQQLNINGSLYSSINSINITRGFTTESKNNTDPAVNIKYNPGLLFTMPGKLMKVLSGWKQGI